MKIAVGSDERTHLTDTVVEELRKRGHDLVLFGPLAEHDPDSDWPYTSSKTAEAVAMGRANEGIVFCWTGTGASIAANKVAGIRAALCHDSETARGARKWNDANIVVMSLRSTPEAVAREICDAWLEGKPDPAELPVIDKVRAMDEGARRGSVESRR